MRLPTRFRERFAAGYIAQSPVDMQAALFATLHHQIGALGGAADPQHRVAPFEEALGDRMKDLVERIIANVPGPGKRDERQREPFADDGNMTGPVDRQRVLFHHADILRHPRRIVARARAIGSGDENHLPLK